MMTIPGYTLTAPICEAGDLLLYRATRSQDGLPVLLKVPAASRPAPVLLRRLEQEYELARGLDSSRISKPLTLERNAGNVALVMEQGPDRTLVSLLGSPMDIPSFLQIAIGITAALAELHRHDLVHKDLKPDNVLLDAAGHVWLTGLGIASRQPRERQALEPPEVIAGTLAYMAPEQTGRMNRSIDSRSDLYALGVTFYQMLTGVLPFTASDAMEWVHCHIARQPIPPSHRVPDLPVPLSVMVMKLLAKTAEERYQSTAGLDADLRQCLAQWESNDHMDSFTPGQHDVPDRLLIPEKLYGRKPEIDVLLAAFDRVVASGTPELVLVSGYSGIGKTSVVHELHKALVPSRGLFAAGKFDQFKRDIPYATLVQALQTLVRQILGKREAEVAAWRDALQKAVSPNGLLIVSLIPEVELIIGRQPPVADLPPQEARNRFQMVLLRFLGVFAQPEHPLVLFLDDLQWLDTATLDLIEQLATGQEVPYLLLIGAYRDNEVGPTHPLRRVIEAIRKRGTGVREIVLAPLTIDDVSNLVADALRCDRECALPLSELAHEKTGGNPFFVMQFLTALAEEKLLAFDQGAGRWTWDLPRIHAKGFADNVVDLMVAKLGRLPETTQAALKQFACLGNVASIATLTMVCGQSEDALHATFWEAARAGLIARQEGAYTFLHDRVQEAAYALVPEVLRNELHLKIGRMLLAQYPQEALVERVFDVVDQFNRSVELVTDAEERQTLRRLNTTAGRKARTAVAFASARRYLEQAMALLPADHWNECYAESLALCQELAESEYLVGNLQRANQLLTTALEMARTTLDLASVHRLRLRLYQISGRYREALWVSMEALRLFAVTFPEADADIEIATKAELNLVPDNAGGWRIADLRSIPLSRDAETRVLVGLLADAIPLIYLVRPNIFTLFTAKAVNICLRRGHGDESSFLYSSYAMALAADIRNILTAQQFSEMAIELSAQTPAAGPVRGKILFQYAVTIRIWRHHFATSLPLLEQAFHACLDFGDLVYAAYQTKHAPWLHLESGDPLEQVAEMARRYATFNQQSHNDVVYHLNRIEQQFALCLQGKTRSLVDFSDAAFDEASSVASIKQAGLELGIAFYSIMKQIAAFIDEQYDKALEWADRAAPLLVYVPSCANEATHYFYHALTLAALHAEAPADQQRQFAQTIAGILGKLKCWADNCPENFANRYFLVSAEIARIEGRDMEAMRLYDQAIGSARDNNFVHQEALAAEIASRFYRARGFDRIADTYLRDAHDCYARWGAQGKVRQLEQRYPQLREEPPLAPIGTFSTGAQELDILAVVRASQVISGEIRLDNLLKTLIRIVLENAGARQGYLLEARQGELSLAAAARVENQDVVVHARNQPGFQETELPASILNFVRRSRDKVLLDDATSPNPYSEDEYFSRRRPRSVLCLPITKQTRLISLLYLENDLATYAFTPDRLAVLEMLASQAAISLENALVYEALRESEAKYRRIVDTASEGIWLLGPDTMTTSVNARMAEMLGFSAEEMSGRPTTDFMFAEDVPDHLKRMENRRQGLSDNYERRFRRKNGETLWTLASATPILDEEHHFKGSFAMFTDITARKRAEERMRLFFEHQLVGMAITSPEKGWIQVNDKICEMMGYPRDELLRLNWAEMTYLDDLAADDAQFERLLRGEIDSYMQEKRFVRKDGSLIFTNLAVGCVRRADRTVDYVLALLEDITERKRGEESILELNNELFLALNAAEAANKAKSMFLANMSHELRTPLNAILGFSSMLRCDPHLSQSQRDNIDIVSRSGDHLLILINDILEMAKVEAGGLQLEVAAFDLGSMVREVGDMMRLRAQAKGLQLLLEQSPEFPRYIKGDEARLRQILINLVGNAVKFTERGGVTIHLGTKQNATAHLLIGVEDTGPGIPLEDQQHIFEPFVQLGEHAINLGAGLGLAITRQFVQLMGGSIAVDSTPGKGSLFRVELPITPASAADVLKPAIGEHGKVLGIEGEQSGYRILIAEDQQDNQLLLFRLMTAIGLDVKIAEDGEQCLKIFQEWRPHLIWMDRRMPVMDGIEATQRIRRLPEGQTVKIVAIIASVFKEQQQEMLDAGMDDFVRKPYCFDEIYECLSRQLGVQYIYADAQPTEPIDTLQLTAERLSVLPQELRYELIKALESLEQEHISTVIGQVLPYDLVLYKTLSQLAENFNYPTILNALRATTRLLP
jgi:PAS domain S-box-containing protein